MMRGRQVVTTALLALLPGAALACGWWGESVGEADIEQIVVGGADDGIDLETPDGMAKMSRAYRLGVHVPKDPVVARLWAGRAAKAGHIGAMNDYAQFLERGLGGPEDLAGAAEWFSRAAEAGNPNAQHSLANFYFDGRGVKADAAQGESWLRDAARAAHPSASAQLASMIWAGSIAPREPGEACLWWLVALQAGLDGSTDRCTAESPDLTADQVGELERRAAEISAESATAREGSG